MFQTRAPFILKMGVVNTYFKYVCTKGSLHVERLKNCQESHCSCAGKEGALDSNPLWELAMHFNFTIQVATWCGQFSESLVQRGSYCEAITSRHGFIRAAVCDINLKLTPLNCSLQAE